MLQAVYNAEMILKSREMIQETKDALESVKQFQLFCLILAFSVLNQTE